MCISINNLSFSYGTRKILKNIHLDIEPNCLLSVLGANGVGKSTLFKCILGLLKGYTGEIAVNNINTKNLSPQKLAKQIAYIPQSHHPIFNYSVIDVVLMGTTSQSGFLSIPKKEQKETAYSALEQLKIRHLAQRGYAEISGGERQLVIIARALAQQAKILIMDEPTSNLDYGNQVRVLEEVKKLTQSGYTVIQSTHNPEQAFLYADQVLVLKEGAIEEIGKPNEVLNKSLIKNIYDVNVELYDLNTCSRNVRICIPNTIA
jgi:iron complex transport system ATP-binding protein